MSPVAGRQEHPIPVAGGNHRVASPGGEWRSLVMEIVMLIILFAAGCGRPNGRPQRAVMRASR